jgi:hypothetical protein
MIPLFLVLLFAASGGQQAADQPGAPAPAGDLARARLLYAAASYEEALAVLPQEPMPGEADEVDRYKALCLLALGRTTDAEQALERLVTRSPRFQITQEDSPRIVELFREVRRRVLPLRAESLYRRAKADFDDRLYAQAAEKFAEAADIMGDPDVGASVRMQELRIVAQEFRTLAEERAKTAGAAAVPPAESADPPERAESAPTPELAPPAETGDAGPVYTYLNSEVRPPVEVTRRMPPWNPPPDQAWRTFRGLIEVVVDATGRVQGVRLLERIAPFYDVALTEAAWDWTFEPARLNGQPVRFRHQMQIVIRP